MFLKQPVSRNMSSWKSSSSKSLLDPEAMLDLEDQLDYEPDGVEHESDNDDDIMITKDDYIKCVQEVRRNSSIEENKTLFKDQDCIQQVPEPSGQEDHESSSSGKQSLSYGTDLEKNTSVTPSFRDKINYTGLHIDVEQGSLRSRFGRYSTLSESVHLDSSDEEQESDDSEIVSRKKGSESGQNTRQSLTNVDNKNSFAREESYTSESRRIETLSSEHYDASSEPSRTFENMVSPREILGQSPQSGATTIDNAVILPNISQATQDSNQNFNCLEKTTLFNDNKAVSPPKKRKSLNFSIQVVGNERIYLLPTDQTEKKKPRKPWVSKVGNFIEDSDVVKLTSKDEVISFMPVSPKSGLKNRLGYSSSNSPSSQTSESGSGLSLFKIPLKRPPARHKETSKILSVSVDLKSRLRKVGDMPPPPIGNPNEDKDDIISLMASCLSTADELEDARDRQNQLLVKEEPFSLPRSSSGTERARIERTAQWVSKAIDPSKTPVPSIYRGLCYTYFFKNHCTNKMCKRSHLIVTPQTRIKELPFLNIEVIKEAYDFAKEHPFLYGQIYKHFAQAFAVKDMKSELINMVNIIFEESSHKIDQKEGLATVLNALQKTNLTTFEDTVEYLLLQIGLKRYPCLGSVLLEIICDKSDLSHHWPMVRRLIIAGEKINSKLGTKFLVHLMKSPVNVKVCQEVYQHILTYKCLELPLISNAIRDPFLKICSQEINVGETTDIEKNIERNLRKERSNFERAVENKQTIIPDFSVPPPTTNFFKPQVPPSLSYIPPIEFGSGLSHQTDFATLSRQESAESTPFTSPPPLFDLPPIFNNTGGRRQSNAVYHDVDLRYRPQNRDEPVYNNESSEDDLSPKGPRFSDSDSSVDQSSPQFHPALLSGGSRKRSVPTGLMYNKEGLHYDPANDYAPPPKKRVTEPQTAFDRLKKSRRNVQVSSEYQNAQNEGQSYRRPNNSEQVTEPTIQNARTYYTGAGTSVRRVEFNVRNNEAAVSSSSDAKLRDEKPPENPQFGILYFDPNYEFNISLHNLYLQAIDNVDIDEEDVHKLNDCVKLSDGKTFLALVEKYKGPKTIQNFISMTLAHLKGMNQMVARTYQRLLDSIEQENPWFYGNLYIRVVLEVTTMNLLFELFQRNMIEAATNFLNKFTNWDSLVTSRLLINSGAKGVSIIGRYLFIAKILNFSKPELTYEILVYPALHLLEKYEIWPYHPPCPIPEIFNSDLEARNNLIVEFLKSGYLLNTVSVIQLYKTASRKKIWQFDVKPYVDPMVVELINRGNRIVSLKQINNEINIFYKHMAKDTLRALLISLCKNVSEKDLFTMYEKCVERAIYQRLVTGENMEYTIEIKTSMLFCEIELIIKYYFHKLTEIKKVPPGSESLKLNIILPGESSSKRLPILNSNTSVLKCNEIVRHLLKRLFSVESISSVLSVVEVPKKELVKFLDNLWT